MSLIYAIGVAIVAQIFIYSGLIFMAGKLLPNLLTPVYHLVPTPSNRLLFSSLTVMLIGNCFFQYLYSLQPILIAGIRKRRWVDYRTKNAEYFNGHRSHSARHRGGYLRIRSEPALSPEELGSNLPFAAVDNYCPQLRQRAGDAEGSSRNW